MLHGIRIDHELLKAHPRRILILGARHHIGASGLPMLTLIGVIGESLRRTLAAA